MAAMKFTGFITIAVIHILHHFLITLFIWDDQKRLSYILRSNQRSARLILGILNIKYESDVAMRSESGKLLIANHLSYVDVLVLMAERPAIFITSVEMREIFFLGTIAQLGGCLFVERRKRFLSRELQVEELKSLESHLIKGRDVFLFPEGTSSSGETILPFKATFFQPAIDSKISIQPFIIKYLGEDATLAPWYGDMTFPSHLFKLCKRNEIRVSLTCLNAWEGHDYRSRFTLAHDLHQTMKEAYERH